MPCKALDSVPLNGVTYSQIAGESHRERSSCTQAGTSNGARADNRRLGGLTLEALLGRRVLDVPDGEFADYVAGATVLITGAAGSLGTELAARLTRLGVGALVLVDNAEVPLVELTNTLRDDHGFAHAVPALADIRNARRALNLVARYQPDVVFHAAAYKQVPLVEAHPVEGVETNVLATRNMVDAARSFSVERFVLFSTDKAVQPTSILGQTKAVAEWIVMTGGDERGSRFSSVRLGNVVDSAGSILPIFRRQIARGGPVTVTHAETTRYLMTSAEAAGLAIVAGAVGDSSGVLWLNLDPAVRVLNLARRLIRAASADIGIDFVGLRPGERLHEQLFSADDEVTATSCERVFRSAAHDVDPAWLNAWLAVLGRHVERASANGVRAALAEMHGAAAGELAASGASVA